MIGSDHSIRRAGSSSGVTSHKKKNVHRLTVMLIIIKSFRKRSVRPGSVCACADVVSCRRAHAVAAAAPRVRAAGVGGPRVLDGLGDALRRVLPPPPAATPPLQGGDTSLASYLYLYYARKTITFLVI